MKSLRYCTVLLFLTAALSVAAQNQKDMVVNEVLLHNSTLNIDDYGNRSGWVELFNSSYGTVDISGCNLTDDLSNPRKYTIPKGDVRCKIKPRQHVVIYMDGMSDRGTFHASFTLDQSKMIYFVSSSGVVIDSLKVPALGPDCSYGRLSQAKESKIGFLPAPTPGSVNVESDAKSRADLLAENDPYGGIMAVTAMSVVFCALILLYFIFKFTGKFNMRNNAKKEVEAPVAEAPKAAAAAAPKGNNADVYAAIAVAMHLYLESESVHDVESNILTIKRGPMDYSPWSAKFQTVRQAPTLNKR